MEPKNTWQVKKNGVKNKDTNRMKLLKRLMKLLNRETN